MEKLKLKMLNQIIKTLESEIKTSETGLDTAETESRFHKGAMQSRYDTWKEESQYLAGAYGKTLVELREKLSSLNVLKNKPPAIEHGGVYAVIKLEDMDTGDRSIYFLLPAGGGTEFEDSGKTIKVVSLGAPISNALIGKHEDDEVRIKIGNSVRNFIIISIE